MPQLTKSLNSNNYNLLITKETSILIRQLRENKTFKEKEREKLNSKKLLITWTSSEDSVPTPRDPLSLNLELKLLKKSRSKWRMRSMKTLHMFSNSQSHQSSTDQSLESPTVESVTKRRTQLLQNVTLKLIWKQELPSLDLTELVNQHS